MVEEGTPSLLRAEGLTKVYEGTKAVDSLDIEVRSGEIFGFLGPNGAGKTTTINMMVGLIEPTAGRCMIGGIDVIRSPIEAKRIIGYLPDGVGFYAHLSAKQNLKYLSKFYSIKDADARIDELIKYVGLGNVNRPVGKYSRGMKQRLGLALALLNDPQVLLMDEPTNGLDPEGVMLFRRIVKEQAADGKAILLSSHALEEVGQLCSRFGIIKGGKMIVSGNMGDVHKGLRSDGNIRIKVRGLGALPDLKTPGIVSAVYQDGTAEIVASSDISDLIAAELYAGRVQVKELRVVETSLEDIFMQAVFGGA
jgi:ABC-2 type transport system ATP-binding protein